MKTEISKEFTLEYMHRVHSQVLDEKYSIDGSCACRRLHGHSGLFKICLEADILEKGMVTDFKHLNIIKKIVDDKFDHKAILDKNDPLLYNIFSEIKDNPSALVWDESKLFAVVDPKIYENLEGFIQEKLEGLVVVDFVPTSENLCKFLADLTNYHLKGLTGFGSRFRLKHIDFSETRKSHCRYIVGE